MERRGVGWKSWTEFNYYCNKIMGLSTWLLEKNHLAMQEMLETWVRSLDWEDPLEESMQSIPLF